MLNLDYKCVECAQEIVNSIDKSDSKKMKELENNLRKALGVLQEDGVYAMFLWLEKNASRVREKLVEFFNKEDENTHVKLSNYFLGENKSFSPNFDEFCKDLREVAENLDKLLFMKKLLERTLTYALYHVKAKRDKNE